MRTTVRLPDDLYRQVKATAAHEGRTVTSFLEAALRDALERQQRPASRPRYRAKPHGSGGVLPGVDIDNNAALLDLMDHDARG